MFFASQLFVRKNCWKHSQICPVLQRERHSFNTFNLGQVLIDLHRFYSSHMSHIRDHLRNSRAAEWSITNLSHDFWSTDRAMSEPDNVHVSIAFFVEKLAHYLMLLQNPSTTHPREFIFLTLQQKYRGMFQLI